MSLLLAATAAGPQTIADNLSVVTYTYSTQSITDSVSRADNLSVTTYAYSAKNITDLLAKNDSLSVTTYAISAKDITDSVTRADNLSVVAYTISAKDITDSRAYADNLSTVAYVISAKDITDVVATGTTSYADDLSVVAYTISVPDITDVRTGSTAYADDLSVVSYTISVPDASDDLVPFNPVAPTEGAGSGWPYLPTGKKTKEKRFDDELAIAMRDIYEGVEPELVQQAAKIVRPFVKKGIQKTAVPKANTVDWARLEKDAQKVNDLLQLWQEQLAAEDEEDVLLLLSTVI